MCCKNLTCVVILTWSCLKVPAMFLGASLKARPLQEGWPNILHFQSKPGQHLVYRTDFLQQETLLTCTSKTKMEFKPENSLCVHSAGWTAADTHGTGGSGWHVREATGSTDVRTLPTLYPLRSRSRNQSQILCGFFTWLIFSFSQV